MRRTFAPLDDVLVERLFQPVSNLLAHRAGLGRNVSACLCADLASIAWIASRATGLSDSVFACEATAVVDLALLLLGLAALVSLRMLFRRAGRRQANPLRPAMRPHRATALLMLLCRVLQFQGPTLADTADLVMLLCAAAALYLGACAEPPPVRRSWVSLAPAG